MRLNRIIKKRSFIILIVCMLAWVILTARLFYLQIIDNERYESAVLDNIQRETTVSADRGVIYDRNMIQLATNATAWRVFISPIDIKDTGNEVLISTRLSEILDVPYDTIYEKAKKTNRADETIKKNVGKEKADEVLAFIEESDLDTQIHLEASTKRYYPYGSLAAHTIGFVGTDGGLFGLEYYYNNMLTGTPGVYISAKNARGTNMPSKYETYIPAENGANLVTTLDMTLQYILQEQLDRTYIDSEPLNRVAGIVMDVNTGGVLAMATAPGFSLEEPYTLNDEQQAKLDASGFIKGTEQYQSLYSELLYSMWRNKAVSELYEPGSTFKVMTTAMGFEEDVVSWNETFYCPGYHKVPGWSQPIRCHKRAGHGLVTYAEGLQQSCNPTLMQLAERIGNEKFYAYFTGFGYTEKTGIDLPSEAMSIFHQLDSFHQVELAVYSFGQTFKVTPIQQLTALCAVANGGYLVTPHLISKFIDDDGNIISEHETEIKRQIISSDVSRQISEVLEDGVSGNGGARNAYVAGYKVAAKTGTSEVRDILNEEGNSYLRVGSCIAYAPADDPQIAIIIMVDQPQCENVYGSVVAAPYVSAFLNEALPYLGIERSYTTEELEKLAVTVREYVGWTVADATQDITNRKIQYEVIGKGTLVEHQIPAAGSSLSKDTGKIILYTGGESPEEYVSVPKVLGMSALNANRILTNKGFNVLIEGAVNYTAGSGAVVVEQKPAHGENAQYGSVVTITMRHLDATDN